MAEAPRTRGEVAAYVGEMLEEALQGESVVQHAAHGIPLPAPAEDEGGLLTSPAVGIDFELRPG